MIGENDNEMYMSSSCSSLDSFDIILEEFFVYV